MHVGSGPTSFCQSIARLIGAADPAICSEVHPEFLGRRRQSPTIHTVIIRGQCLQSA